MHVFMLLQICIRNAEQKCCIEKIKHERMSKERQLKTIFLPCVKPIYSLLGQKQEGSCWGGKREKEEWGGSRAQSIPQMKSKRQSVRHKHACHPWELAGGWWLIRFLLSLFLCKWERSRKKRKWERERGREREREGGIYIALDWMLWCLLNWCRSSPEKGEGKSKRPKTKEGWSWEGQPQQKKRVRYGWKMHVSEERWDRAQEVNLEQISIVIEQESRMWRVVTGSG